MTQPGSAKKNSTLDVGPPELARQRTMIVKEVAPYQRAAKVVDEMEIDRLLLKGEINASEHATLENFGEMMRRAGLNKLEAAQWGNGRIKTDPSHAADRRARSMAGIARLLARLDDAIGRDKRQALVSLCLDIGPADKLPDLPLVVRKLERALR